MAPCFQGSRWALLSFASWQDPQVLSSSAAPQAGSAQLVLLQELVHPRWGTLHMLNFIIVLLAYCSVLSWLPLNDNTALEHIFRKDRKRLDRRVLWYTVSNHLFSFIFSEIIIYISQDKSRKYFDSVKEHYFKWFKMFPNSNFMENYDSFWILTWNQNNFPLEQNVCVLNRYIQYGICTEWQRCFGTVPVVQARHPGKSLFPSNNASSTQSRL